MKTPSCIPTKKRPAARRGKCNDLPLHCNISPLPLPAWQQYGLESPQIAPPEPKTVRETHTSQAISDVVLMFCSKHKIILGRGEWWYPCSDQRLGQIAGLPQSAGKVVITNGIMCYIERADGTIYEGHIGAWEVQGQPKGSGKACQAKTYISKRPALVMLED